MPDTSYDSHMLNYYYGGQFRNYIIQFMAIFAGLRVATGKNDILDDKFIEVPITYALKDRVVASILAENTQNSPIVIPHMFAYLSGVVFNMDRNKNSGVARRQVVFPVGGEFPADLKTVYQNTARCYDLTMNLSIITSNQDQMFQILEQIFMMFDPLIQIQTSDGPFDISKITTVQLHSCQMLDEVPQGTENTTYTTNLEFELPAYLVAPNNFKDNVIQKIKLRIDIPTGDETVTELVNAIPRDTPAYQTLIDAGKLNFPQL